MRDLEGLEGERIRRLNVDEYLRLAEAGAFEDERVELLDGLLVVMSPIGGPHTWIVAHLLERLILSTQGLPVTVISQSSVHMTDYSMPEPDIAVMSRPSSITEVPRGGLLVIEVAASSLRKDIDKKSKIYAEAKVPEYWVVDIDAEEVLVQTELRLHSYANSELVPRSGVLRPTQLPGVIISVDELFRFDS